MGNPGRLYRCRMQQAPQALAPSCFLQIFVLTFHVDTMLAVQARLIGTAKQQPRGNSTIGFTFISSIHTSNAEDPFWQYYLDISGTETSLNDSQSRLCQLVNSNTTTPSNMADLSGVEAKKSVCRVVIHNMDIGVTAEDLKVSAPSWNFSYSEVKSYDESAYSATKQCTCTRQGL